MSYRQRWLSRTRFACDFRSTDSFLKIHSVFVCLRTVYILGSCSSNEQLWFEYFARYRVGGVAY